MIYNSQEIFDGYDSHLEMKKILLENKVKKFLLVCDNSFQFMFLKDFIPGLGIDYVQFSDFTPNPLYEDVKKGIDLYRNEQCDFIVSVGGGSAIDVAKCIKLFVKMDDAEVYLKQEYKDSGIKHLAIPSTAGTGSESTRFAVCYYEGEKQSIAHESIIPDYAILEPRLLETLPLYQKKATMLDALCQAIESFWSVNSNEESKEFSRQAIALIMSNIEGYLNGGKFELEQMSLASNLAGRAINITQTTAAHAMSYKITSLYGTSHGHAVALCLPYVWEYMSNHLEKCIDHRGQEYLQSVLEELDDILMINKDEDTSYQVFKEITTYLGMDIPTLESENELEKLVTSVNPDRLRNFPIELSEDCIRELYVKIFKQPTDGQKKKLANMGKFDVRNFRVLHHVKQLQKYVLEILLFVDKFCEENNIPYYLGEGTLLGALRHNGFIPWDDDVDILMMREDYERFEELAKEKFPKEYALDSFTTNPKHWTICAKVQMTRETEYLSYNTKHLGLYTGPCLDIFPIDRVPEEDSPAQRELGKKIARYRRILWNKTGYSQPKKKRFRWYVAKMLGYVIRKKRLDRIINKNMMKYHNTDYKYRVNYGSVYSSRRQTVHEDVYGEPKRVMFEGHLLPIPSQAEVLLKKIYGNYMTMPPKKKRTVKHSFHIKQGGTIVKL